MKSFADADCVICLGDLTDDSGSDEANAQRLKEISAAIHSYGKPFYCLMGNHDCDAFEWDAFNELTGGAIPPFCLRNGEKALVFLDANYDANEMRYSVGKVDWTDTRIPSDQIAALDRLLKDPDIDEAIIFVHQNLDPNVQWQHIIANSGEIREMLSNSGKVRRVIQGHYHPGYDSIIDGIRYHTLPAMCEGEKNYFEIMDI